MLVDRFQDARYGTVDVYVRRNTSRISARWKEGRLVVYVPPRTPEQAVAMFLNSFEDKLAARRPSIAYPIGTRLSFPGLEIEIVTQRVQPGAVMLGRRGESRLTIGVGEDLNPSDPEVVGRISRAMCMGARHKAEALLIPRARWLAANVRRQPAGFVISKGHHVLGLCTAAGVISLSYALVFLPQELRDYVVYHELAHLSEMNHGREFHHILDAYLNGREKALTEALRNFPWPILRH